MSHEPDSPATTATATGNRAPTAVRAYHDADGDRTLVETVLDALERASGGPADRSSLRLYDSVDPDALNDLFEPTRKGPDRDAGSVSFSVGEFAVTVEACGHVSVRPTS